MKSLIVIISFFMFFLISCGDDVETIRTPEEIIQDNVDYCKSICKLQDSKCNLNNTCNRNCDKIGIRLTELYQEKNISYNLILEENVTDYRTCDEYFVVCYNAHYEETMFEFCY